MLLLLLILSVAVVAALLLYLRWVRVSVSDDVTGTQRKATITLDKQKMEHDVEGLKQRISH